MSELLLRRQEKALLGGGQGNHEEVGTSLTTDGQVGTRESASEVQGVSRGAKHQETRGTRVN